MNKAIRDSVITDFVSTLLWECTATEIIDALEQIDGPTDLGHWIAEQICVAIYAEAQKQVNKGHPDSRISALLVNQQLLQTHRLENDAFRQSWNNILSPVVPPRNSSKWRLPELISMLVEYTYRETYAGIYKTDSAWTVPLDTLQEMVKRDAAKLDAIYNRIPTNGDAK